VNEIDVILAAHRRDQARAELALLVGLLVIAGISTGVVFAILWLVDKACG
jgi:hypothetical protein